MISVIESVPHPPTTVSVCPVLIVAQMSKQEQLSSVCCNACSVSRNYEEVRTRVLSLPLNIGLVGLKKKKKSSGLGPSMDTGPQGSDPH